MWDLLGCGGGGDGGGGGGWFGWSTCIWVDELLSLVSVIYSRNKSFFFLKSIDLVLTELI